VRGWFVELGVGEGGRQRAGEIGGFWGAIALLLGGQHEPDEGDEVVQLLGAVLEHGVLVLALQRLEGR
jgi:hypothetical protein